VLPLPTRLAYISAPAKCFLTAEVRVRFRSAEGDRGRRGKNGGTAGTLTDHIRSHLSFDELSSLSRRLGELGAGEGEGAGVRRST